jgi:hypothetical protein
MLEQVIIASSDEGELSNEVHENTKESSEAADCVSTCNKASDSIERSQPADDGFIALIAGSDASDGVGANHSTTVSFETSSQGINTSSSVRNDVRTGCNFSNGVRNITNSGAGASGDVGKDLGTSTDETGAHSEKMSDITEVGPEAFASVSLDATGSGKQNTVTAGDLHVRASNDIFDAKRTAPLAEWLRRKAGFSHILTWTTWVQFSPSPTHDTCLLCSAMSGLMKLACLKPRGG